jgi:hypothetical protein
VRAYFDESGKHAGAEVITIAGLLMSTETRKELTRRWLREAARRPPIPLPFHMTDCVVGSKRFEYLRADEGIRLEMQMRMIRALRGLDMHAFGASVVRKDFRTVETDLYTTVQLRDPWFLAFEAAIDEMMSRSEEEAGKKHRVSLVFDRQDEFGPRALQLYRLILKCDLSYINRLGGLTFETEELPALQAVDIVAYEVNRNITDARLDSARSPRMQLISLRECIQVKGTILDEGNLRLLVEDRHNST